MADRYTTFGRLLLPKALELPCFGLWLGVLPLMVQWLGKPYARFGYVVLAAVAPLAFLVSLGIPARVVARRYELLIDCLLLLSGGCIGVIMSFSPPPSLQAKAGAVNLWAGSASLVALAIGCWMRHRKTMRLRASLDPTRCQSCGYNLIGTPAATGALCPECGLPVKGWAAGGDAGKTRPNEST